jgi:hypothetical protein
MTRKQQVLEMLRLHVGTWVNGTDLATEEVGGSEGLKRLRELRQEGYPIERRKHPDPAREIFQYQLTDTTTKTGAISHSESEARRWNEQRRVVDVYEPSDPEELVKAWRE